VKGKDDIVVIASPYKASKNDPTHSKTRKIIEQNNFTNQSLHIIGQQLDRIEEKIESSKIIEKPISLAVKKDIEKPLISLPEERRGISLKTNSQKNLKKIEEMLQELGLRKATQMMPSVPKSNSSNITFNINKACVINHDKGKNIFYHESEKSEESDSSASNSSTDEDIKILEKKFGKIETSPKVQRIFKSRPVNLTKNWYNKPIPPDLQYEERIFQNQFSVSADKFYEWNIDGLSEQEILNKMNHISMVANAYMTNHDVSNYDIVELLVTGFSGTLNSWWDKHLTQDAKTRIKLL
jgi:hypothetical protein